MMLHRLGLALTTVALLATGAHAAEYRVIDGDTIALGRRTIRLYGIDAPELHRTRCPAEAELGKRARDQLDQILRSGAVRVVRVKVRKRDGSLEPRRDKYGRELARVFVGGKNVGDRLIELGLAKPYFGKTKQGWC